MKILIPFFLLLFSFPVFAQDNFWVSNKLEVGYNKAFISNQATFNYNEFTKNSLAAGLKFKLNDNANLKTFYLLENILKNNWKNNHFLGIKLNLKLQ
jgi:hypothetical protein